MAVSITCVLLLLSEHHVKRKIEDQMGGVSICNLIRLQMEDQVALPLGIDVEYVHVNYRFATTSLHS